MGQMSVPVGLKERAVKPRFIFVLPCRFIFWWRGLLRLAFSGFGFAPEPIATVPSRWWRAGSFHVQCAPKTCITSRNARRHNCCRTEAAARSPAIAGLDRGRLDNAGAAAKAGPAECHSVPRRLSDARALLVASPHFVLEGIDLSPKSNLDLRAGHETWVLCPRRAAPGSG